jgi:hypothetical protein
LGRDGHGRLGGLNWDEEIAKLAVSMEDGKLAGFTRNAEFFDLNNGSLYRPCEQAKIDFSNRPDLERLLVTYEDRQLSEFVDTEITRAEYTRRTQYLVNACAIICDRLLSDIPAEELKRIRRKPRSLRERVLGSPPMKRVEWADVEHVCLVGGGSLSRKVQEKIGERWGKKPELADRPQHQVVFGAARMAASLKWDERDMSGMALRCPHSYGFIGRLKGKKTFFPIIEKNCRVPAERGRSVQISGKGAAFQLEIVEERKTIDLCSGQLETTHSVVKRFSEPVPVRSERAEGAMQANLTLVYRNDREITFGLRFRDTKIIEDAAIHGDGHGPGVEWDSPSCRSDERYPPGSAMRSEVREEMSQTDEQLPVDITSSCKRTTEPEHDPVDCTVFAPPEITGGDECIIQVFAHVPRAASEASLLATRFDEGTVERGFTSLETEIKRNTPLQFHFTSSRLRCDDPVQELIWRGRTTCVQFIVCAPETVKQGTATAAVTISQENIPVGRIAFQLKVVEGESSDYTRSVPTGDASQFNTFFISYASEDRPEVLKRIQMLRRFGKRYFQDVLDLGPGDRWERKLYLKIDESDAVLLFWSSNAKQSEWVMRECRYTIEKKGIDHILPVIIEGPPPVEPPEELAELHMNDRLLYFMCE